MKFYSLITLIPLFQIAFTQSSSRGDIESCDDLAMVFDNARTGDVVVSVYPFAKVHCENFTTFTLDSGYDVTLESTDDVDNYFGSSNMRNVRFEVLGGSKLTFGVNVEFELDLEDGDEYPDLNGGSLYIGTGSNVVFLEDFEATNVGTRSQTVEDSDFPDHQNYGGVVWNDGYFRVNGHSVFTGCEISGGGEGSPGPGGCLYNNVNGSVLFVDGVSMSDVSILDDEGNNGAGIYNLGKVNIRGDSVFMNLRAERAGAVYNGEGAVFNFKNGASVSFYNCRSSDGDAGTIYNAGNMSFSGVAVFMYSSSNWRGGAIVNVGYMKLSKNTMFFETRSGDKTGAPIYVKTGGTVDYVKKKVYFVESSFYYEETLDICNGVYYEENESCDV